VELFVLGTSHSVASANLRERMHMDVADVYAGLSRMVGGRGLLAEAVPLSTCGRLEVYGVSDNPERARRVLRGLIAGKAGMTPEELDPHSFCEVGDGAVRHVFRVASGLDSAIHGEAEILGQVRDALHHPGTSDTAGPLLHRLFQHALAAGKRVRTETEIGRGSASLASAAVRLLESESGSLHGRTALVLGAGDTGALVAHLLRKAGIGRLVIANRTEERADVLAAEVDAEATGLGDLGSLLEEADIVVGAVARREELVGPGAFPAPQPGRTRYLLDLGHPRNFDPALGERADVRLFDLEQVFRRVEGAREARRSQLPRAEEIVREEAAEYMSWLRTREAVPVLKAVREQVLAIAESEADRRSRGRSEKEREELRQFARSLARTLLHSPTVALRDADPSSEEGRALLQSATSLFGVSTASTDPPLAPKRRSRSRV